MSVRRSLMSRPIARCCRRWWRVAACGSDISTGYRRAGLLFEKHRDHFGRDGDDVLGGVGCHRAVQPDHRSGADCQGAARRTRRRRRRNGTAASAVTLRRFCPTATLTLRLIMTGRWSCGRVWAALQRALPIRPAAATTATVWPLAISRARGSDGRFVLDVVRGARRRSTRRR